jgi:hypothetical protein
MSARSIGSGFGGEAYAGGGGGGSWGGSGGGGGDWSRVTHPTQVVDEPHLGKGHANHGDDAGLVRTCTEYYDIITINKGWKFSHKARSAAPTETGSTQRRALFHDCKKSVCC